MLLNDNPIRKTEDDELGRTSAAKSFAEQVLGLDTKEGLVVGVLGPWGAGKTSFINLARPTFETAEIAVLEFNPWMFSGTQQLVESFFSELSAQLNIRPDLKGIAEAFGEYGEMFSSAAWVPLIGAWAARAGALAKAVKTVTDKRKDGIGTHRAKIEKALASLSKPIIILVDDIDRLSTAEIRDIFKLVRLTASFPNLIYVVAFDRDRVESALQEQNVPGRAYLEKILQVAVDLPAISETILTKKIAADLDAVIGTTEKPGPFDDSSWPDVFVELISPLIKNMRDVRRYTMAVRGTLKALEGNVALADVLALEAIRTFLPDVFAALHRGVKMLTSTSDEVSDRQASKKRIEDLVRLNNNYSDVVKSMIRRLFPAAQYHLGDSHYPSSWKASWLLKRRVAHADVFRFYLERVIGDDFQSFMDAEAVWAVFSNQGELDSKLRSLPPERLQDIIASLEVFEDRFSDEQVVPATTALLNIVPDIPAHDGGMFRFHPKLTVGRMTLRLLRRLATPASVEQAVREILPKVKPLSSKLDLIVQIGYKPDAGFKLVSEEAAKEFESNWRNDVRNASSEELQRDPQLLIVLLTAKRESPFEEPRVVVHDSPEMTLALLRSAQAEMKSRPMSSRSVTRTPWLQWDALVEVNNGEDVLRQRIDELKSSNVADTTDILSIVDKYLSGWRPKLFGQI
jgi:predicted KAP-like P-loop ATPase